MTAKDDAKVVHVFVEDHSVVQLEDVCDWLKILDTIEGAKTQYDTAQQEMFFWVRFKHAYAAQQAVEHLDGQLLKNQLIRIRSSFYAKRPSCDATADDSVAPAVVERKKNKEGEKLRCVGSSSLLPCNHRMPPDLRMDAALVDVIPMLLAENSEHEEFVQKLRRLQESYCRVQEEMKTTEEEICRIDREVTALLQGGAASTHSSAASHGGDVACANSVIIKGKSKRIRNTTYIPVALIDPAGLILEFSKYVGPVAGYSFSMSADGNCFKVIAEFVHDDDATRALGLLAGRGMMEGNAVKRTRVELDANRSLASFAAFGWDVDTTMGSLCPQGEFVLPLQNWQESHQLA